MKRLGLLLLLGAITTSGFASDQKVGTSGALFLRIGAGARPTGMAGAFTAIADDVNAAYYNPAGLGGLERPELTAMHTQWFQGLGYDFGAFAFPTQVGTFAFSAATLKTDSMDRTAVDESNLGSFRNLDSSYALSYGRNLTDRLSLGITGRLVREQIDTASAQSWSTDLGVRDQLERFPVTLGLAVRHLGPAITFREESDPQPLVIDFGAGFHLLEDRLTIGTDLLKPRDNNFQYALGTEWKQKLRDRYSYAFRAGYTSVGTDPGGTTGFSLGAGLGFQRLEIDFAWVPFGDLGNTFRYAALMRF